MQVWMLVNVLRSIYHKSILKIDKKIIHQQKINFSFSFHLQFPAIRHPLIFAIRQ